MSVNIDTQTEIDACNSMIAQIKEYQSKNWAIGLNADTLQPDAFSAFFNARSLPFAYYVCSQGVNLGGSLAYEQNIATLQAYLASLEGVHQDLPALTYSGLSTG